MSYRTTTIPAMNAAMDGANFRRWVFAAVALAGMCVPLAAQAPAGCIKLKSGEDLAGEVLRELGESYVIHAPGGLKILPKASVASIVPGPAGGSGQRPSLREAEASRPPASSSPTERSPTRKEGAEPGQPPRKGEGSQPPIVSSKSQQDKRLDLARATGQIPLIEIAVAGKILQRPLASSDPFTVSRLTHFLSQVSQPRFEVVPTRGSGAPGSSPNEKKSAAAAGKAPEYRAEIVAEGYIDDVQFFGLPLQKVPRAKVLFRLEKISDKKVIEELAVMAEEPGGDPAAAEGVEELCRSAYNRAVLTLIQRLGQLNAFGGPTATNEKTLKATGNGKKS